MGNKANYIFPECFVDTNIMKTLLYLEGVNHRHGCNNVLKGMNECKSAEKFAVGIIDDDKRKPTDFQKFKPLTESKYLKLLKHEDRLHFLIVVCKAAEDFLISCVNELQLNLSDYGFPETLEELKKVTKNCESDKNPQIKKLINAVRNSSEMSRLERTLKYLQENQCKVNIKVLQKVFEDV